MKVIVLIFALAIAGVTYLQAQDNPQVDPQKDAQQTEQTDPQSEVYSQDNKELIEKEDLPAIVLQEFNNSVYKQWTIEKVYKVEASDKVSYELHLTQPGETMVLIADSEGQLQPKPKADS